MNEQCNVMKSARCGLWVANGNCEAPLVKMMVLLLGGLHGHTHTQQYIASQWWGDDTVWQHPERPWGHTEQQGRRYVWFELRAEAGCPV